MHTIGAISNKHKTCAKVFVVRMSAWRLATVQFFTFSHKNKKLAMHCDNIGAAP